MIKKFKYLFSNSILKSSFGILFITVLVKALGYTEKLILANYFGTSYQVDAYTLVLTIVLSIFFFFREIIEPGFLNVFLDCRSNDKEKQAWGIFNTIFRWILYATLAICVLAILYPQGFSSIFAPGFESERLSLTNNLIRIAIPAGIFLALSTLTSITLNGLKIFVLPASGELAFKGGIIICMVLFYKEYGIIGAGIGIVIGSMGRLAVHLTKLYKQISFRKTKIESIYKKRIWYLTWPLLLGVSFSQISGLVDNMFASYLQEGAIAALSYAKKVVELPVILFPYVISIVIFPYFTQLSVEKQNEKLHKLLGDSLKWILIAFTPVSVFFIVYSIPIIEIVFQRGAFDAGSTALTAKPFQVYSTGLIFFAIETILVIFYYSIADTKTPVFVGIICVIINIMLTWLFIQFMGYTGIALAFVIQKGIKNIVLLLLLKRKIVIAVNRVWGVLINILIASMIFTFITIIIKSLFNNLADSLFMKMVLLAGIFTISGMVYLAVLYFTNVLNIGEKIKQNE
jgi:putative peptidoglycan lipid II flippase